MRRAHIVLHAGSWSADQALATLTLAFSDRHRRRVVLKDDQGEEFLLDLPQAAHLRDGDGLALEGGGVIEIIAQAEDVAEVHCATPEALARIAWHVGNRHMPVQILPEGRLRLPWDHVLVAMLQGLGAAPERHQAPFQPEGGAYGTQAHAHPPHSHDPADGIGADHEHDGL